MLKKQLKKLGYTTSRLDFDAGLEKFKETSPQIAAWIDRILKEKWSIAYDAEGRRFGHMTTNLSECVNKVLKDFVPLHSITYHQPFNVLFPSLCTNASSSYIIINLVFSPDSSLEASKGARFDASQKPDSVFDLFRKWGFSKPHLDHIITRESWLISCNLNKRVVPKFQFLLFKGASSSDIVFIITKTPRLLRRSHENHIVPTYELMLRFLPSDKGDLGFIFSSTQLLKRVEKLKELGFNPSTSKSAFSGALLAKHTVKESKWDEKVDVFKKWGWSDENIHEAFGRNPNCMLVSCDKINAVTSFWVNELGWDALALVKGISILGNSLEKRNIPRAFVVQYLLAKGLIDNNDSLLLPC
ncbi:uncharacterized protein LOC133312173 [Gastrolobium bilobum]|uniref:uncharacterized protein LOC133312173 n=1 Tax=Gastrolobium bilobum TaxID=150636 RepID=UPI002AB24903|nr:uncharacterized protein LOC133312173 [Gastrolobium bilobum]